MFEKAYNCKRHWFTEVELFATKYVFWNVWDTLRYHRDITTLRKTLGKDRPNKTRR